MKKELPRGFKQCFVPFKMLTVYKSSDTGLFGHVSNSGFSSLWFQKKITYVAQRFFESISNFM